MSLDHRDEAFTNQLEAGESYSLSELKTVWRDTTDIHKQGTIKERLKSLVNRGYLALDDSSIRGRFTYTGGADE